MNKTLFLIDNDPFTFKMLDDLYRHQWKIVNETLLEQVLEQIKNYYPTLILFNANLGHSDMDELFDTLHQQFPEIPMIVYTPVNKLKVGRDLVKRGAFWHLTTPLNILDVEQVMKMAVTLEQYRQSTLEIQTDFQQLEAGIARISLPFEESLPKNFTFEQDDVIQGIIDLLADILEVEIVSLMLLNSEGRTIRIKAAHGLDESVIRNTIKKSGEGIAGKVAEEGRPLLIKDVEHDQTVRESAFYDQYTTKSLICVPLKAGARVVGVLNANNKRSGRPFDEHDLYLTTIFSHLLVITLQNAQLHHDREKMLLREAKIGALNRKISAMVEPTNLFQSILIECCSIFQADSASLFVLNEQGDELNLYWASPSKFMDKVLPPNILRKWLALRGLGNFVSGSSDREEFQLLAALINQEIQCWVSAPLILEEKLVGSLEISSSDPNKFKDSDKHTLARVAQQACLALNNVRLYGKLLSSLKEISEARKEVEKVRRKGSTNSEFQISNE
jgi:GAF domain-containing protein